MKRFVFLIIVISFSLLIWGCSEEIQSPTAAIDPEQQPSSVEDSEFDAELNDGQHGSMVEYEVTLENLSPATGDVSSQPFSPPVLATHKSGMRLFKRHHKASDELRQIAEDAVNAPMVEKLKNSMKVFDVVEGTGVIFPESSDSFIIKAKRGYDKLSLVCMLVNTNDAFTGVTRAKLPRHGKESVYYLHAYDAGTEKNTELTDHIPGPCCGNPLVRVPTHERIKFHQGIMGIGDLDPAVYGWYKKVAKLTIRRVK